MTYHTSPAPSGKRFEVLYRLWGDPDDLERRAMDICIEQTVEFPADLLPEGDIPEQVIGRIEELQPVASGALVRISYPLESAGNSLVQLLNTIYGNTSLKPGVRVEKLLPEDSLLSRFRGPRFGVQGLRARLNIPARPLLCTAIKPLGLSAERLAEQAYQCALGGMDIIKDDHGVTDQVFAPFKERVELCARAVARANQQTGYQAIYMPSLGLAHDRLLELAHFARQAGAGGLLVMPALTGFDSMRLLADDDGLDLPLIMHPAFLGGFTGGAQHGISHYALYGQITRLAGADATIFPNYGGRFSFSKAECLEIAAGARDPLGHLSPIFPTPGGGMTLERVPEMLELYGQDLIFLIGGDLHRQSPDLVESSRYFRNLAERMGQALLRLPGE
jgi:ribulose-bisphosphate carboxylase large chain